MFYSKRIRAEMGLALATLMWGLSFPLIRIVVQQLDSVTLLLVRSILAFCFFLPLILLIKNNREKCLRLLPFGALLAFFYGGAFLAQSIGLETIASARSAFLTNLTVVFVPLLSPLFGRGRAEKNDIISIIISLIGMFFLTNPITEGGITIGDFWTLLGALLFAFQILFIQKFTQKKSQATVLVFWEILFVAVLMAVFLPFSPKPFSIPKGLVIWSSLIYLGIFSLALSSWLQAHCQKSTTPERAAVIFILEPVFASVFGYLLLHEVMSVWSLIGGALMIVAILWLDLISLGKYLMSKFS